MKVSIAKFQLFLVVAAAQNLPALAYAQPLESRVSTATSSAAHQLFMLNPAVAESNKMKIGYTQAVVNRDYDVTHVNTTTGNSDIDVSSDEVYHGIGFSVPLGGASFGLTGQLLNKDVTSRTSDSTTDDVETYRTKEGAARITIDLMPTLRMALAYRMVREEVDILGSYMVNNTDRTNYAASLSGYVVGFFFENNTSGIGASYNPPIRGKAKVEGEQKIVTETGLISLDAFLANGGIKYGLAGRRWVYQRDDRAVPATSPVNLSQISLNGVDIEQFYMPKEQLMLGVDYPLAQSFSIGFNIYRTNAVFLYAFDQVPGDQPNRERAMHSFGTKLALGYANNEIDVRVGVDYAQRKRSTIIDDEAWFGYWNYNDYKATDQAIFAAINLTK